MRRRDSKFPENGFEAWGGYMQAKIAKLEEQFSNKVGKEENTLSNIFNGISIYVNGYTIPSADELRLLMAKHGGVYHTYQKANDFIIASNLPDTKVKNMSLAKVVKPEWIIDSIASNRLLQYRDYLLYKHSRTQTTLKFIKPTETSVNGDNNFNITVNDTNSKNNEDLNQNELSSCNDIKCTSIKIPKNINEIETLQQNNNRELKEQVIKTAADPNFISEFYNNSRLHHISQLGANFKQHINDLRENSNFIFVARSKLKEKIQALDTPYSFSQINFSGGKIIMHIDMDCFFVSVGLRNRPELRGKPVAVTHSKGGRSIPKRPGADRITEFNLYKQKQIKTLENIGIAKDNIKIETRVDNITEEDEEFGSMSEIASCSYEARAKGVRNGMFMGAALRLCPDLKTISYDFEGYKEVAYTLYNTIAQYTLDIEAVSCDEMYVDCTDLLKEINFNIQDFATVLRNEIKEKTGCPCSTGFGGNRLQARLATKRAKPDGQFFLTAELIDDFMIDIKLKDLPGVGRQISQKLESIGHQTCGSLQNLSLASLQHHLGNKTGSQLYDQCRGCDTNPLTFHTVRKSVSAEVNYGIRFENDSQCLKFLKQLSAEVHSRMHQFKVLGKCITLKLMVRAEGAPMETAKFMGHGFCNVMNKSASLSCATNNVDVITKEVITLYKKQKIDPRELRGIGIQITKLESINCKQTKGTISKFLLNKPIKQNNTLELEHSFPVPAETDITNNNNEYKINEKLKLPTTPKKFNVSPKKSPIIGSFKSPTGKKRGRPSKNVSIRSHQAFSINLMNKFLQGQTAKDTPYQNPIISKPIMSEEPKKSKGLLALPWQKVRELLRAWLESGQTPLPYDISLITEYLREMVITKNIDKLNILLNFLRRRIFELDCKDWKDVYSYIVENVQSAMIAVYGKELYIGD